MVQNSLNETSSAQDRIKQWTLHLLFDSQKIIIMDLQTTSHQAQSHLVACTTQQANLQEAPPRETRRVFLVEPSWPSFRNGPNDIPSVLANMLGSDSLTLHYPTWETWSLERCWATGLWLKMVEPTPGKWMIFENNHVFQNPERSHWHNNLLENILYQVINCKKLSKVCLHLWAPINNSLTAIKGAPTPLPLLHDCTATSAAFDKPRSPGATGAR